MHTPLLTAVVPGAIPGAGTNSTEHVRHRRGNGPENRCAPQRRPECDSLVLRHYSSLSSSTAEHSVDNRKTVERHHAEGPFYERWMAQTDERRVENPQRLARYQLQRPFHCGIDVTASMSVFQTERAGAAPACRTNFSKLPRCKSHAHHFASRAKRDRQHKVLPVGWQSHQRGGSRCESD